jgi:hypothetical protein
VYLQYGFLYLILIRPKFVVWRAARWLTAPELLYLACCKMAASTSIVEPGVLQDCCRHQNYSTWRAAGWLPAPEL